MNTLIPKKVYGLKNRQKALNHLNSVPFVIIKNILAY